MYRIRLPPPLSNAGNANNLGATEPKKDDRRGDTKDARGDRKDDRRDRKDDRGDRKDDRRVRGGDDQGLQRHRRRPRRRSSNDLRRARSAGLVREARTPTGARLSGSVSRGTALGADIPARANRTQSSPRRHRRHRAGDARPLSQPTARDCSQPTAAQRLHRTGGPRHRLRIQPERLTASHA